MREIDSDLEYKWWFRNSRVKYLSAISNNNIFWNHAGTLRSWYITEILRIYTTNRFSLDFLYNNEYKLYEKKYFNYKYKAELGYNTDEWSSAAIGYTWGVNYDRDFSLASASLRFRPMQKLALQYSFERLDYTPDPLHSSTSVNILVIDYNFTPDLWIRALAQNNSGDDKFYFYGLFGWRFQPPFGALYLIYTTDERQPWNYHHKQKNRIFFLKFAYQFSLR